MSKDSSRRGQTPMAGQRQIEPAAHAVSRYGGKYGGRELRHSIHQSLSHLGEFVSGRTVQRRNLCQVRSSREKSLIARNDQRLRIPSQFLHESFQSKRVAMCQTVSSIRRMKIQKR